MSSRQAAPRRSRTPAVQQKVKPAQDVETVNEVQSTTLMKNLCRTAIVRLEYRAWLPSQDVVDRARRDFLLRCFDVALFSTPSLISLSCWCLQSLVSYLR